MHLETEEIAQKSLLKTHQEPASLSELGKVTLKSNSDEALSDESP
jgi:hypothetical protein